MEIFPEEKEETISDDDFQNYRKVGKLRNETVTMGVFLIDIRNNLMIISPMLKGQAPTKDE